MNETDHELLKDAAKAIGWRRAPGGAWLDESGCSYLYHWNPLTDDGDAIRLAVKLQLKIEHYVRTTNVWCVQVVWDCGIANEAFHEEHGADANAATRRAIVRVAAEIGRGMATKQTP